MISWKGQYIPRDFCLLREKKSTKWRQLNRSVWKWTLRDWHWRILHIYAKHWTCINTETVIPRGHSRREVLTAGCDCRLHTETLLLPRSHTPGQLPKAHSFPATWEPIPNRFSVCGIREGLQFKRKTVRRRNVSDIKCIHWTNVTK